MGLIFIGIVLMILGATLGMLLEVNPVPTFIIIIGAVIMLYGMHKEPLDNGMPTAMDVYQGKTTLKITYIDGVAVDSVVVYKQKSDYGENRQR